MNSISILSGETLFDVAIREYGHMQGVAQLAKDNNIELTSILSPGSVLKVDDSVTYDLPAVTVRKNTSIAPNTQTVHQGQNIFDIAIQEYGTLQGIEKLTIDNSIGLTENLPVGSVLNIRNEKLNKLVVEFLAGKGLKIATDFSVEQSETLKPQGIGYWKIGVDFTIS
ncbi:hypothetical protein [Saccharicrinis fermentans]|uniref:hypothetical protein n=1 Tax=Saccharicrinis fermentans TaxID=982 RepID=UPI0004876EC0|nr:hypothetical protein [Saccharicrinis fermentans]